MIITVADNGPGVPDAVRDKLFQPFATAGKSDGTGLGLATARNLVVGHGGTIRLDETAQGASFSITLPRLRSERKRSAA